MKRTGMQLDYIMYFLYCITNGCPLVFMTLFLKSVISSRIWFTSILYYLAEYIEMYSPALFIISGWTLYQALGDGECDF